MGGAGKMEPGHFAQATLIVTEDVNSSLMVDEFFGPIVTPYVYPDGEFEDVLCLIDGQGAYDLTGSVLV